jgi:hypothetical protein
MRKGFKKVSISILQGIIGPLWRLLFFEEIQVVAPAIVQYHLGCH